MSGDAPYETFLDLPYAEVDGRSLLLDLYVPPQRDAPLPVIVWVHGGAWLAGSKSGGPAIRMAERGYAVASVSYRLSGEAKFPAQIHDCKAAVRWLRANAARYSLDPERIGAWGLSAGGHLVALLGTSGGVPDLEGAAGNLEYSSRVQAVVDWFGPTDLLQMDAQALPDSPIQHDAPDSPESLLIGCPIQTCQEKAERANPIRYVTGDEPPFLIMHGDQDLIVPPLQSQLLYDALKKVGVDATLYWVEGAGHGFGGPGIDRMVDDFFDRHLKAPQ